MGIRRTASAVLVTAAATMIATTATVAPAGAASAAPTFTLVDLGLVKKTHGSGAVAVSANGKYAALQSNWPSYPQQATRYHSGHLKTLGTLGGVDSQAYGVDNAGQAVGSARDAAQLGRAFEYSGTTLMQLPDLGGDTSAAEAINDHGVIVGTAAVAGGSDPRAVEWTNGQISVLPGLGPSSIAGAQAVNEAGDAAGYSWNAQNSLPEHAILWRAGQPVDVSPSPFVGSEAYGLNAQDAVVGGTCVQTTNPCTDGAWITEDGVSDGYQMATGGPGGIATAINDHWMIVGRGQLPNQVWEPWVMFNGQRYDLNSLLAPGTTGWQITQPVGVNNLGDIIATANDTATNQGHAVLLVPTAAPAYDRTAPTGTVTLAAGATSTSSATVPLVAAGSDPSGIFAVRISNKGTLSSTDHRLVKGVTVAAARASAATPLSWDLSDPATGGTGATGTHTVWVQWLDWAGNWSKPISAKITLS